MERTNASVGCLLIGDAQSRAMSFARSIRCRDIALEAGITADAAAIYPALQYKLSELSRRCASVAIVAFGRGALAALALASQLTVDRIALIDAQAPSRLSRDLARLNRFVRMNIAFCTADILLAGEVPTDIRRLLCRRRSPFCGRLLHFDDAAADIADVSARESLCDRAVYSFLLTGDYRKSLAENPEMCIIYG